MEYDKIVLYSTGCPRCQTLKMLLDNREIAYEENNSVEEMLKLGFNDVPVLMVGGNYLNYNQSKQWLESLCKGENG